MFYLPYFRGKQFELIAIRELAPTMASHGIIPIIEPVRDSTRTLERAIGAVADCDGQVVIVMNPKCGALVSRQQIAELVETYTSKGSVVVPALIIDDEISLSDVEAWLFQRFQGQVALIHDGFTDAEGLKAVIGTREGIIHIFHEVRSTKLYRQQFNDFTRVIVRDGMVASEQIRNADHRPDDPFSDLHATYTDDGYDGFGDFLTVGDAYSEGSGGPAYAVVIHMTRIEPSEYDAMRVYHFKSSTNDTPVDPGGKFKEALDFLVSKYRTGQSNLILTSALTEFLQLHQRGHFPGLGYVKKLSMKHHVETLACYYDSSQAG